MRSSAIRPALFAFLVLILIGATSLIVYGSTRTQVQTFHGKLVDLLPEAPPGWIRTLRPIADSTEMKKIVGELLNFDDGIFVEYTQGNLRLSVYIAYWTPGKMTHRDIARHTPDVCWVSAGWQRTFRSTVHAKTVGGRQLPVIETRIFTARGMTEYVWFWHIVRDKVKSYGTGGRPPWYAAIIDVFTLGLGQRDEQFFIRLSSPQALDSPALSSVMVPIVCKLPLRPVGQ